MKKKGLVKTVQVKPFSASPKCFYWKSLRITTNIIKCDYFLSIGFPGPVWQDRGLYIRPPIKDPIEKSCPGRLELQSLPYHVLYIALWATAKCTENFQVWSSSLSIYCWCDVCERALIAENPVNRRKLVIGSDAGDIWATFFGLKTDMKCSSRYCNHSRTVKGPDVLWIVANYVDPLKVSKK